MREIILTSSVLITVIAILRRLLRGKISPRLQYALCLLVALRLLLPGTLFTVPVSVTGAADELTAVIERRLPAPVPADVPAAVPPPAAPADGPAAPETAVPPPAGASRLAVSWPDLSPAVSQLFPTLSSMRSCAPSAAGWSFRRRLLPETCRCIWWRTFPPRACSDWSIRPFTSTASPWTRPT